MENKFDAKRGERVSLYESVRGHPLWEGIGPDEFADIGRCLGFRVKNFRKDETILFAGDTAACIGQLASGSARVVREDANGNSSIISELVSPETFGETFACAGVSVVPVTVAASSPCLVMFVDYRRVVSTCSSACGFHARLIENMLAQIAKKNLELGKKIEILSLRKTRDKLLAYLNSQRDGAGKFKISFNREELSRYLCVDRSAMSGELCKMRDEGLIRFRGNEFEIMRNMVE